MIHNDLVNQKKKLAVIGLGYVGLPIALEFAKKISVIGFDIKSDRIEMMKNKIEAIIERKEIRDGFDIEFMLRRGINFPELTTKRLLQLKNVIEGFTEKEFKVTLGSVLESDIREYYISNRFGYLLETLSIKIG